MLNHRVIQLIDCLFASLLAWLIDILIDWVIDWLVVWCKNIAKLLIQPISSTEQGIASWNSTVKIIVETAWHLATRSHFVVLVFVCQWIPIYILRDVFSSNQALRPYLNRITTPLSRIKYICNRWFSGHDDIESLLAVCYRGFNYSILFPSIKQVTPITYTAFRKMLC